MKYIYNHSINAYEIYTGCEESICDKSDVWFRKNLGFELENRHQYFSHLLVYTFDKILKYLYEHKVRFEGPMGLFYIDLETFADKQFMLMRRRGRFQEIDIVESDFKGYIPSFYYKAYRKDNYFKRYGIYTTQKHMNLLAEYVNRGDKMYSLKSVRLENFLPMVQEYCPLSIKELKKILYKGFMRMYYAIKQGCYVSLKSRRNNSLFFIGNIYRDTEAQLKDYFFRYRLKAKKLWVWSKEPIQEEHYIAIDVKRMAEWSKLNGSSRPNKNWIWFEGVYARKHFDVVCRTSINVYIFKITLIKKHRWKLNYWISKAKFKDAKYIGHAINYKFQPEDRPFQELITEFRDGYKPDLDMSWLEDYKS